MRRCALALLAACFALPALARGIPEPVAAALARARVPASAASIVVTPVDGGFALVSHNADVPMNPASVMKLVTSYAALDLLGPAFTFHTDVLYTGTLANGVLDGDLFLRGGGDPKLTYEKLWQLAHQLRSRGLREIRGDVIVDRSYFAPGRFDPGSFDNEPRRAYNVGSDALLVNFQAIDFTFIPTEDGVRVTGEPDLPNVEIASRIKLTHEPCGWWRRDLHYEIDTNGLIGTVLFTGAYPADCGEQSWPLAVFDGPRFLESSWRWAWSEAGGVMRGKMRAGAVPAAARLFYRHDSEPLANLVRDMNKFSNNVMTRHLFLALSAERNGRGTPQASVRIVKEWLAARGIDAPELVLENGSGLSRSERVSARNLAALLKIAWASPLMPELAASLPVFAVDGTLRSHNGGSAGGQAHLKGGTLDGVQALAGYVLDRRGRRWIAVMILNHANANAAQPALDALVDWVYRQDGAGGSR